MRSVVKLEDVREKLDFGGKAVSLARMLRAGLPVPPGVALGLLAFSGDGRLTADARRELIKLLAPHKKYAVRSSAVAEDAQDASWAGQFESFLNVSSDNIAEFAIQCHNSAKARAQAYAANKSSPIKFDIAVVVQEMVQPDFAGVLFTKDPVGGDKLFVTEFAAGLGESLVSGIADPTILRWRLGEDVRADFDVAELTNLVRSVEQLFDSPQDIEWALADGKIWIVQARPITAIAASRNRYDLGEPADLFYWGPSRAKPLYMSDFMAAIEQFFVRLQADPKLPSPPRTLVLFWDNKMVWLNNADAFAEFTKLMFEAYDSQGRLKSDVTAWLKLTRQLEEVAAGAMANIGAWTLTLFAEFALYGAEAVLTERLARFDAKTRQQIWGCYTIPDKPTFLSGIDAELLRTQDPAAIAQAYSWIEDGYSGVYHSALGYFTQRLQMLQSNYIDGSEVRLDREAMATKLSLQPAEIRALDLARELAEFMDNRKAWMMRTRRYIFSPALDIEYGWYFTDGEVNEVSRQDAAELWQRYIEFKASDSVVKGLVASTGGRHFVSGRVKIVMSPTDNVLDDSIIVVPATSPSYVPLMRRARGMVTDHGGIMSHAAIVGREFNLPCIVGTQQATKVLKDGDKVVLDLVLGVVRR